MLLIGIPSRIASITLIAYQKPNHWSNNLSRSLQEKKALGLTHAQPRRSARFSFAAELLATELNSGTEIWGETTNLNRGGCYVRTKHTFPQGTLLLVEIRHRGVRFVTDARVAYDLEGEGMGLAFLNVPATQLPILEDWLSQSGKAANESQMTKVNKLR